MPDLSPKKYIADNVPNQTITGQLKIEGGLTVADPSNNTIATYRAIFNQTGVITGTNINDFNGGLIIGERYTIIKYLAGDDFSNIAEVESGNINEDGCIFVATGQIPAIWSNNTELSSEGNLVVQVLENSLGYDISWFSFVGPGTYIGFRDNLTYSYVSNTFPKNKLQMFSQINSFNLYGASRLLQTVGGSGTLNEVDDVIFLGVYDWTNDIPAQDSLYYTPVEIKIKQDLNTTPILLNGSVESKYPFSNVSVNLFSGGDVIGTVYSQGQLVSNLEELVSFLNTDPATSYLGTYSSDIDGNIFLSMPTNLKDQTSPDNTLTFVVFND
jgi:hypothetical protein